jgi:hypothetical protein
MASADIYPILKEALVKATLRQGPLMTAVFVANITGYFILGLDILRAHDASVDLRRRVLRMGDDEVPLWRPGALPRPSPCMKRSSRIVETE